MGRDLASVICTFVCFQWSVLRWCNGVGAPYSSNQVTQCCSILPPDAVSCIDWLGSCGEQSGTFKGLDLICMLFCGLKAGVKLGQWFCFLGMLGAKMTFAEEKVVSESSQRLLQDLRDIANTQSSLQEHGLLLWFNILSLKQCGTGAKKPTLLK